MAHLRELAALIHESVDRVVGEYTKAGREVPGLEDADASRAIDNAALRAAARVLESACAQLCAAVVPARQTMLNRALDMISPTCLHIVLNARVAEHLRDGPKSVTELASLSKVDERKLGRVLRNLATKHCFREVSDGVFANNKLSVCLLPEDTASALLWHLVDTVYPAFGALPDVLADPDVTSSTTQEDSAFSRAHKMSIFEMTEKDPVRGARFPVAMCGWSKITGGPEAVVELYPWKDVPPESTFCDVGGSTGHVALALLKAEPHLKAVVQDVPSVIARAETIWDEEAPALSLKARGRVDFVPLDFFAATPVAGCEFYYLRNILHDWSDEECAAILRNTWKAMTNPRARVLVHEIVLLDSAEGDQRAPFPLLSRYGVGGQHQYNMDMLMMVYNGRQRTLADFLAIGAKANLTFVKLWGDGDMKIIELQGS
ncbi:S-adenosyl-L-methionine-dependent methyltransferase [Auricularia subglabra TFB-10046 SS5]|nr:S-adenosyl-L-methionine-dependent methyltransferase [Auricularia subglabra TFB-10046 SS5]